MSQVAALLGALKQALKSHGLTYAALADRLGVSEATVKRMFSTGNFSLERLDRICAVLELDLADLVHLLEQRRQRIRQLSYEQEQELVGDIRLLLVAVCARNHWSFEDIVAHYALSEPECVRYLAKLDRLRLIELLPGNRIKLRIASDFRWIPDGPIERFYEDQVQNEFFQSAFSGEDQLRIFLTGALTRSSHDLMLRHLQKLAHEFAELHDEDSKLPLSQRTNLGVVLALRPMEFSAFRQLRRTASQHSSDDDPAL